MCIVFYAYSNYFEINFYYHVLPNIHTQYVYVTYINAVRVVYVESIVFLYLFLKQERHYGFPSRVVTEIPLVVPVLSFRPHCHLVEPSQCEEHN